MGIPAVQRIGAQRPATAPALPDPVDTVCRQTATGVNSTKLLLARLQRLVGRPFESSRREDAATCRRNREHLLFGSGATPRHSFVQLEECGVKRQFPRRAHLGKRPRNFFHIGFNAMS